VRGCAKIHPPIRPAGGFFIKDKKCVCDAVAARQVLYVWQSLRPRRFEKPALVAGKAKSGAFGR